MQARRCDHIAAIAPDIETCEAGKPRTVPQARTVPWMREVQVPTAPSGEHLDRGGQATVAALEFLERFVTAVSRIDVQDNQAACPAGRDADVCLRPLGEPPADKCGVDGGVGQAMFGTWMLAGVCASL